MLKQATVAPNDIVDDKAEEKVSKSGNDDVEPPEGQEIPKKALNTSNEQEQAVFDKILLSKEC